MIARCSLPVLALLSLLQLAACGAALRAPQGAGAAPSSVAGAPSWSAAAAAPASSDGYYVPEAGAAAERAAAPAERPGLGTRFGEERYSPVHDVAFERQGAAPFVATVRYDDREGVAALRARAGRLVPCAAGEPWLVGRGGPLPGVVVQVIDEDGRPLPGYHVGGQVLVEGEAGRRYALRIENRTGARFEIVASVDGLDVIDGRAARTDKPGYVLPAYGHVEIDGFRRSLSEVAAFRFGSVRDSYAARSAESGDRHVGVIGLALFAERGAAWIAPERDEEAARREQADPFPGADADRFARPPL